MKQEKDVNAPYSLHKRVRRLSIKYLLPKDTFPICMYSVHVHLHTYMDIFYRWKIYVHFEEAVHKYDNLSPQKKARKCPAARVIFQANLCEGRTSGDALLGNIRWRANEHISLQSSRVE